MLKKQQIVPLLKNTTRIYVKEATDVSMIKNTPQKHIWRAYGKGISDAPIHKEYKKRQCWKCPFQLKRVEREITNYVTYSCCKKKKKKKKKKRKEKKHILTKKILRWFRCRKLQIKADILHRYSKLIQNKTETWDMKRLFIAFYTVNPFPAE